MKKFAAILRFLAEAILFVVDAFLVFLLLLAFHSAFAADAAAEEITRYPVAYVDVNAGSTLNVRQTPGGELASVWLNCREDVVILAECDGWALVIRPDDMGKTTMDGQPLGWASMDYLRPYRQYLSIAKGPAAATASPNDYQLTTLPSDNNTNGGKNQ